MFSWGVFSDDVFETVKRIGLYLDVLKEVGALLLDFRAIFERRISRN